MGKRFLAASKLIINPAKGKLITSASPFESSHSKFIEDQALQNLILSPTHARPAEILVMQQFLGNRAVNELLTHSITKQPSVQTDLVISAPRDNYEHEADQVAEQMVMPTLAKVETTQQTKPSIMTMPLAHSKTDDSYQVDENFKQQLDATEDDGQPLPFEVKKDFEVKFGTDLSEVRIHADAPADALSSSIQARAFTTGRDIYFRQGEFQPESINGQRVIAHELAHVRQQSGLNASQTVIQRLHLNEMQPLPLPIETLQDRIKAYKNSRSLMEGFNHLTALQVQIQKLSAEEKQQLIELETEIKMERAILGKLQLNGTIIQSCLLRSVKDGYLEISKISNISSYIPVGDIQGSFALNLVLKLQELLPRLSNSLYQLAHLEGKTEKWAKVAFVSILNKLEGEVIPAFAAIQIPVYLPSKPASNQEKVEQLDEIQVTEPTAPIDKIESIEKKPSNESKDLQRPAPITVASTGAIPSAGGNKPASIPAVLTTEVTSDDLSEDERFNDEEETRQADKQFGGSGSADDNQENSLKQPNAKTTDVTLPLSDETPKSAQANEYILPSDKLSSPSLNIFAGYNYSAEFSGEQPSPSVMGPVLYVSKLPLNFLGSSGTKPAQFVSPCYGIQAVTAHMPASKSALDKARRYESRANDLHLTGGSESNSAQTIQTPPYKLSSENAYFAAKYFQQAGDSEHANSWALKVVANDPASTYAEHARTYLASKQWDNQAAINTSDNPKLQREVQQNSLKAQYVSTPINSEPPVELFKQEFLPSASVTGNKNLTAQHEQKPKKTDNSRSGFAPIASGGENVTPKTNTSKKPLPPASKPITKQGGNAPKPSEPGRSLKTGQSFIHPAFIDVNFFAETELSSMPVVDTKQPSNLNKDVPAQTTKLPTTNSKTNTSVQTNSPKILPASQQTAINNAAPPRELPFGSVTGHHGLTVSPAMITAIRQDIMTRGIDSKWADQHEIRVLASVLGIKIIVHYPNGPSSENGEGNDVYELYYNGKDHYDAKITDPATAQGFRKQRIPGDGDCFYNGVIKIASECKDRNFSVIGLRRQVHDNLTDQDVADIALPLIEDFKRNRLDGIGGRFRTLMRSRNRAGILHYSDT